MVYMIPDLNCATVNESIKLAVAFMELFPGKEKVRVMVEDEMDITTYELLQKIDVCPELLELLYGIEGIIINL